MATGAETSSLRQTGAMVLFADCGEIYLRVAAQTKVVVAHNQHLIVDRAVHFVARRATFAQGFVLPNKRAALLLMAFEASFVDILHARRGPGAHIIPVRAVAIHTTHLAFQNRMMVRQAEFHLLVRMAGKTSFGVLPWIDNAPDALTATGSDMQTTRAVAAFASLGFDIALGDGDARMR